jgi:putative ABC transport system substrate-binding protein
MSANPSSVHGDRGHAGGRRQETSFWLSTVVLALAIFVVPLAADAQPPVKVPRIGFLWTGGFPNPSCSHPDFVRGLHELGYVEGENIIIAWRCAEGMTDRARQFAGELVQLGVDVIVSVGLAGSQAAKAATSTIPIIFGGSGDPVVGGLVPSLARPGGNVTGVSNIPGHEFFATHLALLMEAVPGITRVALLLYALDPFHANRTPPVETAARASGVHLNLVEVEAPHDFEAAFSAMTRQGVNALLVSFTPFLGTHHAQIVDLAAKSRLPAIAGNRRFAEQGGLMSYGVRQADLWRRVASYLDRILKGAKPADLPVELPTTYELVINLKTAQALGLTIPPSLLFRADEVIR